MKRIISRWSNVAMKLGFLISVLGATASIILAFINITWAIAVIAFAFLAFIFAMAASTLRTHRQVSVTARKLRALTTELDQKTETPKFDSSSEIVIRELHLRTLEEVRILHAELIDYFEKGRKL